MSRKSLFRICLGGPVGRKDVQSILKFSRFWNSSSSGSLQHVVLLTFPPSLLPSMNSLSTTWARHWAEC